VAGFATEEAVLAVARRHVKAALLHLATGHIVGAAMILFGNDNFQFFHAHLLLAGGLLFLAYGTGLALLPARLGDPGKVHAGLANIQFYMALAGLWGMLAGSFLPVGFGLDRLAVPFGFLLAASAALYAAVLWKAVG
jgi:hypothetical protein